MAAIAIADTTVVLTGKFSSFYLIYFRVLLMTDIIWDSTKSTKCT